MKTVEAEGEEAQRVYDTDEEDHSLVHHIYKPGRRKQSDIFPTGIRQWFPLHGDGDPKNPRQWRYVRTFDEDLNSINRDGNSTILSNDVASRIWKNSTYAKQEIAMYWPLDLSLWRNQLSLRAGDGGLGRAGPPLGESSPMRLPSWSVLSHGRKQSGSGAPTNGMLPLLGR